MSVGRGRRDSWACCSSLLLSQLLILVAPRVNGSRSLLQTMVRYPFVWSRVTVPRMTHSTTRHWSNLYLQRIPCLQYQKEEKKTPKEQHIYAETHCSVAASLQTLLRICFPLMPLFLPSICTMQRGVHVTQFVFSSLSTESRETAQSRSTQRNCSSTVSLFAEMRLLIALFSL